MGLLLGILMFFSGCSKIDLDFSDINSVDLDGEWGVPVVKTSYSASEILKLSDALSQSGDGTLMFNYSMRVDSVIRAGDYMALDNTLEIDEHFEFTIPDVEIPDFHIPVQGITFSEKMELNSDYFIFKNATLKSGRLDILLNSSISIVDSFVVSSNNLRDENGVPVRVVVNFANVPVHLDVADYKIVPADTTPNSIDFTIKLYGSVTSSLIGDPHNIDIRISANDFKLKQVIAKSMPINVRLSKLFPFDLLPSNISGNISLYNATCRMRFMNSFGADVGIQIDSLGFIGNNSFSPVLSAGTNISCQGATAIGDVAETLQEFSIPSIYFSNEFDNILIAGECFFNPEGISGPDIFIDENATISAEAEIEIPLKTSMNITFTDTVGDIFASLREDILNTDIRNAIEWVALKGLVSNGLPLSADVQLYFVDSTQMPFRVVDSLLMNPAMIAPSLVNNQFAQSDFEITLTNERLEKILRESNNAIVRFKIHTPSDQAYTIYSTQEIKLRIGMKVKYDTEPLDINL